MPFPLFLKVVPKKPFLNAGSTKRSKPSCPSLRVCKTVACRPETDWLEPEGTPPGDVNGRGVRLWPATAPQKKSFQTHSGVKLPRRHLVGEAVPDPTRQCAAGC